MRFDVWENKQGGARIARVDLPDDIGELELLGLLCRAGHPDDFGEVQNRLGPNPATYTADVLELTGDGATWLVRPRHGALAPNGKTVPVLLLLPSDPGAPLFSQMKDRRTFRASYASGSDSMGRRAYFLDWEQDGRTRGQIFRGVPAEHFKRLRSEGHKVVEPQK